jgi:hypothetical protein
VPLKSLVVGIFLASVFALMDILLGIETAGIADRYNYEQNIDQASLRLEGLLSAVSTSPLLIFLYQPLWLFIVFVVKLTGLSPESGIRLIIFLSCFMSVLLISRNLPRKSSRGWLVVMMFAPFMIGNFTLNIRQGVGLVLLLLALRQNKEDWKFFLLFMAGLVHYIYFVVLAIYIFSTKTMIFGRFQYMIMAAFSLIVSVNFLDIASLFGRVDRLEGYFSEDFSSVELGFGPLFLATLLILFLAEGKRFGKQSILHISLIIFGILGALIFPPLSRVFQATSIIVYAQGLQLSGLRLLSFKCIMISGCFYNAYTFLTTGTLGFIFTAPVNLF